MKEFFLATKNISFTGKSVGCICLPMWALNMEIPGEL